MRAIWFHMWNKSVKSHFTFEKKKTENAKENRAWVCVQVFYLFRTDKINSNDVIMIYERVCVICRVCWRLTSVGVKIKVRVWSVNCQFEYIVKWTSPVILYHVDNDNNNNNIKSGCKVQIFSQSVTNHDGQLELRFSIPVRKSTRVGKWLRRALKLNWIRIGVSRRYEGTHQPLMAHITTHFNWRAYLQ